MAWKIVNGQPVRGSVDTRISPPEITARTETSAPDGWTCLECGRIFKTEPGLARHTTAKH